MNDLFTESDLGFFDDAEFPDLPKNYSPPKITARQRENTKKQITRASKIFMEASHIRIHSQKNSLHKIAKNAADLTLPQKNTMLRIRTQAALNMISFLMKIMAHHQKIDQLYIATYTLNKEAINIIKEWAIQGRLRNLTLILPSSYTFRDSQHKQYLTDTIQDIAESTATKTTAFYVWTHFKITLAQCDSDYYLIEGSMNYSQNNMAEQVIIENNRESYEQDRAFFDRMATQTNGFEHIA